MRDIIKSGLLGLTFLGALAIASANRDVDNTDYEVSVVAENGDIAKEVKKEENNDTPL